MLSTTCQKIRCPNGIRGINLIKLEEENSIMKYHKNNILLSSKYLLQSLKLNFQKDQYLNSRFSIPKKSSPITFIPKLLKNVSSFLLIHFFKTQKLRSMLMRFKSNPSTLIQTRAFVQERKRK